MARHSRRTRVFLSHSAKDSWAIEVRNAIVEELKSPGARKNLSLFLDEISLLPGDMWRSRINLWVGGCDVAIILLSRSALMSAYVAYEASILSYRLAMGDGILLVPIVLGDVSVEDLRQGCLAPAQLAEIQVLADEKKIAADIAREVLQRITTASIQLQDPPIERRAASLCKLLEPFSEHQMRDVAEILSCDLEPWIPNAQQSLGPRLAIQLLSVGLAGAKAALLRLRGCLPLVFSKEQRRNWVDAIVENLATSWVDQRSVGRLVEAAEGKLQVAAVALHARSETIARMYYNCACLGDENTDDWHLATITAQVCNEQLEDIIESLTLEVELSLAACLGCDKTIVRQELSQMNSLDRQKIVVSLPIGSLPIEVISELQERFPQITWFLRLDAPIGLAGPLPESLVEMLVPDLDPADEDRILDAVAQLRTRLQIRPGSGITGEYKA